MSIENTHNNISELIAIYLAEKEKLDPEQLKELRLWMSASPSNRKYFEDLREIWFASMNTKISDRFDKHRAYRRFLVRTSKAVTTNSKGRRNHFLRPILYGAAALALLLVVSYISYRQGGETVKNMFTDVTIEAPLGSKTKMFLPDGTLVWLNAGSKMTYSQGFGVNDRAVQLTGEGYFEVVKNKKLSFTVETNEFHVNVLGTKFNFRNYLDEEEATVSLLEGKVLVSIIKKGERVNLLPDQKVFLNKETGEIRIAKVNAQYTAEWTNGYLYFDEVLLPDIIKELERSYNVKITISDESLKTFRFYGNFVRRENRIEDILNMLASTNKIRYEMEGENILLSPK
jgi:ferric-dicitrate binding protein FerR (iron transport regulator)